MVPVRQLDDSMPPIFPARIPMHTTLRPVATSFIVISLLAASVRLPAQEFDEVFSHWPVDFKIRGTIMLANQVTQPQPRYDEFLESIGGEQGQLVIIAFDGETPIGLPDSLLGRGLTHTIRSQREEPPAEDAFSVPALDEADGVMLLAERALTGAERKALQQIREPLAAVIERGGVLYAANGAAKILSRLEISGEQRLANVSQGLNLMPDCAIETRFSDRVDRLRVQSVLAAHPRTVGVCLAPDTALILEGRILRVPDTGLATVMVTANERAPLRVQTIAARRSRRQRPNDYLIDLTQWRRIAMERTLDRFPPADPKPPLVERGTLVIVGGGGMPKNLMERFVELAGGKEKAKLVYVPCAEEDQLSPNQRTVEGWVKMGVRHATFIHTKDRHQANDDEEFLAPLKEATGIWFGGGRQWNFADSYYGTTAHKLMKEVLQRGGVIGGSSAGASIQGRYLARATPISNVDLMAPGYERGGLGFLSGVAIDQHFSQRGRQKDMTELVDRYPQLLGIGIDEATAIIVRKSQADVVGRGRVHFYNRKLPVYPGQPDFVALPAGSTYDLAKREVLNDTSPNKASTDESITDKTPTEEKPE